MSLPSTPQDSLSQLSPTMLKGLNLSRQSFQSLLSPLDDARERVSLFQSGLAGRAVRLKETLLKGKLRALVSDAGSLIIRTERPADFQRFFPKARRIAPKMFRFDFEEIGDQFRGYTGMADPTLAFDQFANLHDLPPSHASPNQFITLPNPDVEDCACVEQWPVEPHVAGHISVHGAHQTTQGRPEIIVAVLDTGILESHQEFNHASLLPLRDIVAEAQQPAGHSSHGTACAGVIVAQKNPRLLGVAPRCSLFPIKVIAANNVGLAANAIEGISCAAAQGTRIVSMSFEIDHADLLPGQEPPLKEAIRANPDLLFVAAAGNYRKNLVEYPAYPASYELPNLISVIGCDRAGDRIFESNYAPTGERAHIAAPADIVCYCDAETNTDYSAMTGTSIAAPHVAGVAALAWSVAHDASMRDIRNCILQSAERLQSLAGTCSTGGRVHAAAAVALAKAAP